LARQIIMLNINDAGQCLALFKSNNAIGWFIFIGLMAGSLAGLM
jgi:4-hydroxybenzoate polyprenyltransferase